VEVPWARGQIHAAVVTCTADVAMLDPPMHNTGTSQGEKILFFFVVVSFCLFRAMLMAYGGSQARGLIRAVAADLHHSPSNSGSKPHLQPTPHLVAMLDPLPIELGQGLNPQSHGS